MTGRAWIVALALAGLAACAEPTAPIDATDASIDATIGIDARLTPADAGDPVCIARCDECGVGYCENGWCRDPSRATCIAESATCDALRRCIMGPDPLLPLPACEDGVRAALALDRVAPIARDVDAYRPPEEGARAALSASIAALAASELATALTRAEEAGYVMCRGMDDELGLVLLRPAASGSGHATLAIDTASTTPLILEAPHPLWDRATSDESVAIFARTGARAVLISGTHRCGSDRASGCDGTADACGEGAPVRESDMAHAVDSMFHAAHLALAAAYPDTLVVSVHGFTGPGISISDGTTDPAAASTHVARIARALHARFPDQMITTCNELGDPDVPRVVRVCGTTNVQGRALNGAAMECTDAADVATDRFVHLEQAPDFRPDEADAIADALAAGIAAP